MRRWLRSSAAAATVALLVVCTNDAALAAPAPRSRSVEAVADPGTPTDPVGDQRLIESIDGAATPDRQVPVEIVGTETSTVETTVKRLGGVVTGAVDDAVVQGFVPAGSVERLADSAGVGFVQSPRLVTRPTAHAPVRIEVGPGIGPIVGQNVAVTNAAAWQAAGIDGSVKVGIVDYFDLGLWSTAEAGPLPDDAHRFCRDTSGEPNSVCSATHNDGKNDGDGYEHGVAVAQVLKDMAPAAELYLASVGTVSDLQAAIDWFAGNGVHIVTRSLGAAYDGPGDGTGPLAAVVDNAVAKGITWFNSAGNDAADGYARIVVPNNLGSTGGYVDFDNGPGVDTYLRVSGDCTLLDGVRWSDWNLPPAERTDYSIEAWAPVTDPGPNENVNPDPAALTFIGAADDNQAAGAPPLEGADQMFCPPNNFGQYHGITYLRVRRKPGTPVVGDPDVLEVALGFGLMELGRSQAPYSAAKPVVDSRNPALVAVGAVDPANGTVVGFYSSQGPTNDGRIKPDVTAPSCVTSAIYPSCFNGTSAASPTAAGMAALLLDAGAALPGVPLAAAVRHFTVDRPFNAGGPPDGPDNRYGIGEILLPAPPASPIAPGTTSYQPLTPTRILDTRPTSPIGQAELLGSHRPYDILDLTVAGVAGVASNAAAVALNVTVTDTNNSGFVQVIPYLGAALGSSSTLNAVGPGPVTRPNFAIVPVGSDGKISIYTVPGGAVIVDVLGYFAASGPNVSAGRFVSIDPVRALDTRTTDLVPSGWVAHRPAGETVVVPRTTAVPASGVAALVLNVTSTASTVPGFLRAQPTGTVTSSSTVNYVAGVDSANMVIVPVGADGTVSVYTNNPSHIVVDVTGYITDGSAVASTAGLFVPVPTARASDTRLDPGGGLSLGSTRTVQLTGLAAPLPNVAAGASAVSLNLTAVDGAGPGFLVAFPSGTTRPPTSSVNFTATDPVANGGLLKLSTGGALDVFSNQSADFVIDVNGYFT